jgi:hypothetical protein
VVDAGLEALSFLLLVVLLAVAFFWLAGVVLDLLTGRRGDR